MYRIPKYRICLYYTLDDGLGDVPFFVHLRSMLKEKSHIQNYCVCSISSLT